MGLKDGKYNNPYSLFKSVPSLNVFIEYEEFGEGDEEDEERNFEDEDPNLTNEFVPLEDDDGSEPTTDTTGNKSLPRQVPQAYGQDKAIILAWLIIDEWLCWCMRVPQKYRVVDIGPPVTSMIWRSFWDGCDNPFFAVAKKPLPVESKLILPPMLFALGHCS